MIPAHSQPVVRSWAVRRFGVLLALSCLVVAGLMVLHIGVGSVSIAPADVVSAVLGRPEESLHYTVVHDLRMPRALIAAVGGAMLGLSGAMLQSITRNPVASPALTGVLSGAMLAVVGWISLNPTGEVWSSYLPLIAIGGGVIAGALVYGLAWQRGSDPVRLTLAGVLVAAMLNAYASLVLLLDQENLGNILGWLIGSLHGRVWIHWRILAPYAALVLPLGLLTAGLANVLSLGDAMAASLGVPVERARLALFLLAVVLAAGAVSIVGNIAFVGLIAPHIARRIVGGDARRLFPFSAVFAAGLLVLSDTIARTLTLNLGTDSLAGRGDVPTGAVTALVGALFFLYLLTRKAA